MPYSDNLYSANDDESDNESFSNELSPTDGFFQPSQMSPNHMVPDPSLDRKDREEEDKVLIPRNETRNESGSASRSTASPSLGQLFPSQNYASSQSNSRPAPPPASSNTPPPPSSYRRTDNNIFSEPNHSMQGPPPAYTPSSPTTSSHSTHNRSYSTFEPHRLEQGLASQPQSMSRPEGDPDERTPLSENPIRKPSRRRLFIKKLLFVALVIAVAIGIMTTLLNWGQSISKKDPNAPGEEIPPGKKPPSLGIPDDKNGPYCASANIHRDESFFDFSLKGDLSVLQTTYDPEHGSSGHSVRTSGEIRIRKLPKNSKYSSRSLIQIDTHVSDDSLEIVKTWDESTRIMKISTPRTIQSYTPRHDDCISLEVTLWLPEDATLSALSIASTTLNLRVFDDVKFKVTGDAEFGSISGDIFFPKIREDGEAPPKTYPLDSRHITIETVSGNIKGIYPLYDYLKLGTQSGDINVGVFPQPVLPSEPAPADLEVSTSSGKVTVNLPAEIPRYSPPPRDYVTRVASVSGDISGTYFLGSFGSFKSSSGDMTAKILPVIQYSPSTDPDDAPKTQFDSWSVSGGHNFDLLDPVFISLLPSNKLGQPSNKPVQSPDIPDPPSNEPVQPPSVPGQHDSPEPYIPIGDDDPYHLLPPDLNEDVILEERHITATKKWRTLKASHQSSSADISVHYPVAWEGTVSEKTMSGDTKVDGKDVKIITYKKGWAYKELVAGKGVNKKGEGSSSDMTSISGDVKFTVG